MSNERTVHFPPEFEGNEFAPDTAAAPEAPVASASAIGKPVAPAHKHGKTKRERTSGENLFDATTYGGFALLGNEVAATYIVGKAGKGLAEGLSSKPPAELKGMDKLYGFLGRNYQRMSDASAKLNAGDKIDYLRPNPAQSGVKAVNRFTYISFAIIGGFLMVPFIKALEGNKGKLVRFADRMIHGKRAETDPNMVQAHAEMDDAPQQSWGSLMQGRITTVAAAYAVDSTINWEHGIVANMTKGKLGFQDGLSIEGVSNRLAETMSKGLSRARGMQHDLSSAKVMTQTQWLKDGLGLMSLSALLTGLFYMSSKVFASRRDHKMEQREERISTRTQATNAKEQGVATAPSTAPKDDAPTPQAHTPGSRVQAIEPHARLVSPTMQEGVSV